MRRKGVTRGWIAALTLVCFTGCTSIATVEPVTLLGIEAKVKNGDSVRITTHDHRVYHLTVRDIGPEQIYGKDDQDRDVTLRISQIAAMERESFSVLKTGALAIGIAAAVVGVIVVLVRETFDCHGCGP